MIDSSKGDANVRYASPKLTVYGEFSKLTASGSFLSGEGTGMFANNFRRP